MSGNARTSSNSLKRLVGFSSNDAHQDAPIRPEIEPAGQPDARAQQHGWHPIPIIQSMADATDPRLYKIGEVCRLADVQPYVLRYWETEFPSLSPNKSGGGQRLYTQA